MVTAENSRQTKPSADFEHAIGLGQRRLDARHVADAERDGGGIETAIPERQRLGIGFGERDGVAESACRGALAADREHIGVDVADRRAAFRAAGLTMRMAMSPVPPATSTSANGPVLRRVDSGDQRILPGAMQPERHQVVHQIVAARDAAEDVVDQRLLVRKRHLARAEIGLLWFAIGHGSSARRDDSAAGAETLCLQKLTLSQALSLGGAMPELPEVETVRRGLEPVMDGARFRKVELRRRDLRWPLPKDFAARLQGKTVTGLGRRAKYLLADLSSGDVLLMHLGMSGSFHVFREAGSKKLARYYHEREQQAAHDHVVFHMSSGAIVTFNDPRRFGSMKIVARDRLDDEPLLSRLGPEPLGNAFDAAMLAAACAGKKTSLKAALLDQRVVAGIGNIYACEALHRALLSPKRMASTIASKSGRRTRRTAGRRHQGGAQRRDQSRRLVAARS